MSFMAEVGLVRFARVALEVAEAVLSDYRTKFSKRTFTQPQLLAVLCLMRYEDWTLRKTEVRLAEHGELRSALGLRKAPDHTTLYRFLRRLDERALVDALNETVRCLPKLGDHEQEPVATVAVDATGLVPGAISTFYVRRTQNRGGEPMLWRKWLKWLIVVDTDRQMVLAQEACSGPYDGSAMLRPLVDAAHGGYPAWRGTGGCGVRQRAQPPPRARTARCNERDPGQAGQGDVARPRLPGQDASHLPTPLVPKAGAGRERLLSGQTQALGKSTRPKPRNAADAGTAAGAGLQPVPAQTLPDLKRRNRPHPRMSTEPRWL